jgi:hypothetical protein
MNRAEHRALVEAGYAPLAEYVAIYPGGCAPPVLAKSEPDAGSSGADERADHGQPNSAGEAQRHA